MKKNSFIVLRTIHDCNFLINTKAAYSDDTCILYEINEVGAFLWNNLSKCTSINELVKLLSNEIVDEVDEKTLRKDVADFMTELKSIKYIEE